MTGCYKADFPSLEEGKVLRHLQVVGLCSSDISTGFQIHKSNCMYSMKTNQSSFHLKSIEIILFLSLNNSSKILLPS